MALFELSLLFEPSALFELRALSELSALFELNVLELKVGEALTDVVTSFEAVAVAVDLFCLFAR